MKLSKDMLAVLASYKDGTQTGTPYAPELCDLGLLMQFEGQYVCTALGHERLTCPPLKLYVFEWVGASFYDAPQPTYVLAVSEADARDLVREVDAEMAKESLSRCKQVDLTTPKVLK